MHCFALFSLHLTISLNASSDLFMLATATVVNNKKKKKHEREISFDEAIMRCNLGKQTVD